jgi:hypothetical protein
VIGRQPIARIRELERDIFEPATGQLGPTQIHDLHTPAQRAGARTLEMSGRFELGAEESP